MGLCSLMVLGLPTPQISSNESYLKNVRRLFANPTWIGFLLAVLLVAFCGTFVQNFLSLYLDDLGASEGLYGLGVSLGGLSELPIFFFSALLMQRLSPGGLLKIAMLAWALRALLISVMPTPEAITLTQVLHGASFSALWAAAVVYAARLTPPGLGTTAQSVMGMAHFSIAGALGGWFGANLYDLVGPQNLFRVGALLALAGFGLFMLVELRARRRAAQLADVRP
jgi:PPP family 3-phenylpropionic acid transporter